MKFSSQWHFSISIAHTIVYQMSTGVIRFTSRVQVMPLLVYNQINCITSVLSTKSSQLTVQHCDSFTMNHKQTFDKKQRLAAWEFGDSFEIIFRFDDFNQLSLEVEATIQIAWDFFFERMDLDLFSLPNVKVVMAVRSSCSKLLEVNFVGKIKRNACVEIFEFIIIIRCFWHLHKIKT